MGKLVVVFKVMPEGVETDIMKLKEQVIATTPKTAQLQGFETKPVAFGLNALHITVLMEDEVEGGPDAVEEAYGNIPGVASASVVEMGRI